MKSLTRRINLFLKGAEGEIHLCSNDVPGQCRAAQPCRHRRHVFRYNVRTPLPRSAKAELDGRIRRGGAIASWPKHLDGASYERLLHAVSAIMTY